MVLESTKRDISSTHSPNVVPNSRKELAERGSAQNYAYFKFDFDPHSVLQTRKSQVHSGKKQEARRAWLQIGCIAK